MTDVEQEFEELEEAAGRIDKEEGRGSLSLWFGVLGSPFAWFAQLLINYSLEEVFACSSSTETPGEVLGVNVELAAAIVTTAMAAIALASLLVAYACWRKLRAAGDPANERAERARWMAFAGVVEGCLFLGVIILGYLPSVTLEPCEFAP